MRSLLLVLLTICFFQLNAQNSTLQLASDVWPPFTNVTGEKSVATDLVRVALNRINVPAEFHVLDFKGVTEGMDSGKFQGSAALWKTAEREESFFFSEPYLLNQLVLVGLQGTDVSATSPTQLTGKKIGVVVNYGYDEDLLEATNLELVYGESDQQNLEKLLYKKIDYMLVDALLLQYLFQYQLDDVNKHLAVGREHFESKTLHLALRKDTPNAQQILEAFNEQIKVMLTDGTYHQVLELNWIKADVDGDGNPELVLNGDRAGKSVPQNSYNIFVDQTAPQPASYYINGVIYKDWDSVPDKHKKKQKLERSSNPDNPALLLRF